MQLNRDTHQSRMHLNNLIMALLTCYSFEYSSMKVSNELQSTFGVEVNWHDVANALDELATKGQLTRNGTNNNGNAVYTLEG